MGTGAAPNERWLTMRNIVQQALSVSRATATERCQRYTEEEAAAILAAGDEASTIEAIAAAEEGASKRMQGHVQRVHKEAQQKPKEEKAETKTVVIGADVQSEGIASTSIPPAETTEASGETKPASEETPTAQEKKPVVKTKRKST